jgi:hypothetical protein
MLFRFPAGILSYLMYAQQLNTLQTMCCEQRPNRYYRRTRGENEMTILDTLLFGIVAGLVTLKVVLLAAAAILLLHVLVERTRPHKMARASVPVRHSQYE